MSKDKKIVSVMIELAEYIELLEYKVQALTESQANDPDWDYRIEETAVQIDKLKLGL